ncbi:MAG: hypothetical protein M1834_006346 [Cirrosporium novae-zelandiae]|nr:MAG: hypothetical protein M1834_006346 [Cirrosporium novae-zelandiae]
MTRPKLTLFIDVVSPFAYFAFYVTKHSLVFKDCDVSYIPVFLGGIMQACGNTPPIKIKNKDNFVDKDRRRHSRQFNIPIADRVPDGFPAFTLSTQRALCAVAITVPAKLSDAISSFYHAYWVERKPIDDLTVIEAALGKVLGKDLTQETMAKIVTPEIKKHLQSNTDKALAEGAFGLPYFVATNAKDEKETFWGFDHIGQVCEHLELDRSKGLGVKKEEQGWRAML